MGAPIDDLLPPAGSARGEGEALGQILRNPLTPILGSCRFFLGPSILTEEFVVLFQGRFWVISLPKVFQFFPYFLPQYPWA